MEAQSFFEKGAVEAGKVVSVALSLTCKGKGKDAKETALFGSFDEFVAVVADAREKAEKRYPVPEVVSGRETAAAFLKRRAEAVSRQVAYGFDLVLGRLAPKDLKASLLKGKALESVFLAVWHLAEIGGNISD